MFTTELAVNSFLIQNLQSLIGELDDTRLAEQPLTGVNHPAWILGHLAFAADRASTFLGESTTLPEEWIKPYKGGSTPTSQRGDYPSRDILLDTFLSVNARTRSLMEQATPEQCAGPTTNARFREALPTVHMAVAFLMTSHVAMHIGQISTWRRMIGLPPRI